MKLIDSDVLKADIEKQMRIINAFGIEDLNKIAAEMKKGFFAEIDLQEAVDAIPVVRCEKCKYLSEFGFCMNPTHSIFPLSKRSDDWFCADGERREE